MGLIIVAILISIGDKWDTGTDGKWYANMNKLNYTGAVYIASTSRNIQRHGNESKSRIYRRPSEIIR